MEDEGSEQGVFDFDGGNMDGLENWRRERAARLDAIRREWLLPVGRHVRIRVRNIAREFEGKLRLLEQPARMDHRLPLRLSIEGLEIDRADIEQCVVLD